MFTDQYNQKKVIVTGNTGFKGAWLTEWLINLGASVKGFSDGIPTKPSLFEILDLNNRISHTNGNVQDLNALKKTISDFNPDFIFHLAAQAIVSTSYSDPTDTFLTNTIGTMNVLEAIRDINHECTVVIITSDKAYDNVEWEWGYKETDALGGKDIYSGSKGAAELVINSYFESFIKKKPNIRLGIARAGNVIGGGDWAKDRIVVDCMQSWAQEKKVTIRSPKATRPWQHVLEPLSGYLRLGEILSLGNTLNGEAFNFGPQAEQNRTVLELINDLSSGWGFSQKKDAYSVESDNRFNEASLLKLNIDKALFHLMWEPNLNYKETINFVSDWYVNFYQNKKDMHEHTLKQIKDYQDLAFERKRPWTSKSR
jgi:CDP-glucose 4,6-dehydratase